MTVYTSATRLLLSNASYTLCRPIQKFYSINTATTAHQAESRFKRHNEAFQKKISNPGDFFKIPCYTVQKKQSIEPINPLLNRMATIKQIEKLYAYLQASKLGNAVFRGALAEIINDFSSLEDTVQKMGDLGAQFDCQENAGLDL